MSELPSAASPAATTTAGEGRRPGKPGYWLVAWWVWFGVLFFLSSLSGEEMQDQPFEFNDKAMHALYFLGGSLLLGGYGVARGSWPRRWWLLPLVAVVVGAFDETHQRFTPGRSVEFADWIADTLGGLLAVPATFVWRDVRDRWLRFVRKKAGVTAPPSAG